jgi:hypothetical protein
MATEASPKEAKRPYPPPSNVIAVLHRLRSRNLPERIDAEYLRDAGIPEGTLSRTLFALRFLGLTKESGELTEAMKAIGTSTDEEYRATLSGLIRDAYSEVFAVIDPADDSQDRIINFFRRYTPGSQRARMVIFFLGMCREAGIPTLDVPKARSMGAPGKQAGRLSGIVPKQEASSRGRASAGAGAQRWDVPPALEGLVKSLPPAGTPMSPQRRDQWLEMAKATLAFVYPEEDESVTRAKDDGSPQPEPN